MSRAKFSGMGFGIRYSVFGMVWRRVFCSVIVLIGIFFAVSLLPFAQPAQAQMPLDNVCRQTPNATICQDNRAQDPSSNALYGPNGVLTKAANILSLVVGIVSVFVLIVGGIRYILSEGDPTRVSSARNGIIHAIIGLIIVAVAQSLVVFVLNRL